MICHFYPGAGDPLTWPLAKLFRFYDQISEIQSFKRGDSSSLSGQFEKLIRKAKK